MPNFSETETHVRNLFSSVEFIIFEGKKYFVIKTEKPRPNAGECKTDVYVKLSDEEGKCRELKISVKQENADFLENKIKYERAKEIFGNKVDTILKNSISNIREIFEKQYLVLFDKYKRTEARTVKLGWKFELLNKPSGELSGELELTTSQLIDIYSGQNLPEEKKNAYVDGTVVKNSGVANYILFIDESKNYTLDDILNRLIPIEKYVEMYPHIYYGCKALNYRIDVDKWDGDRPLAVYVEWTLDNGLLNGKLVYDEPLKKKGNVIGENLRNILNSLNITKNNFLDLKDILNNDVKFFVKE